MAGLAAGVLRTLPCLGVNATRNDGGAGGVMANAGGKGDGASGALTLGTTDAGETNDSTAAARAVETSPLFNAEANTAA